MMKSALIYKRIFIIAVFYACGISLLAQQSNSNAGIDSIKNHEKRADVDLHKKFVRSEDKGEDFSKYSKDSLFRMLSSNSDKIILRKTAKSLGDKYLSGDLSLNEAEKVVISKFIDKCMDLLSSDDSNEREEAKQQIERLWLLAVPSLLKSLEEEDVAKYELAAKSLILMRNEEIIKSIIEQANRTADSAKKRRYVFILSKMNEHRASLIPNRNCIGAVESDKLYNSLVLSALEKLEK